MSQERDLQKYARRTQRWLIAGVIIIVFLIGDGLVFLIYGQEAGWMALICTGLGLIPALLIVSILWLFGWFIRRMRSE